MSRGRKALRKYIVGMLAVVMAISLVPTNRIRAAEPDEQAESVVDLSNIELLSKNGLVPEYVAGAKIKWELTVTNKNSSGDIQDIVVKPEFGDAVENWPFQIEQQEYEWSIPVLTANETENIFFEFTQREDVPIKPYTISFSIYVKGSPVKTQKLYVNTTAKEQESNKNEDTQTDDNMLQDGMADFGGISNGEAVYSGGGGGSDSTSVPRVIVTGFTTNPAEVRAGSDFTLTVHLKNTSKASGYRTCCLIFRRRQKEQMSRQWRRPSSRRQVQALYIWRNRCRRGSGYRN